ncbi:MAG: Ig-like domain-containing protein [Azovibrio sp.]|uniref:hypothetical protein n=1 Tax=Azovibrio sp. TaxID=1872673 RepID=UPI003C70A850
MHNPSTATVTLTIVPVSVAPANQLPVAVSDSFTTNEDTSLTGTLTGNDTPAVTAAMSGARPLTRPTAQ